MDTENIYYCYVYKREDGTPYYIGKGKDNRVYFEHKRIRPPKDRNNIFFACEGISEIEAFEMEIALISLLGRKDLGTGILRNKTDGGDGSSGLVRSEETRQKISVSLTGKPKSEETRRRMSETRKNQPPSEETRKKLRETKKGNNNASKLTDVQRLEIVQRRKNGESTSKLATEFGVTQPTIYNCCKQ